MVLRRGKGRTKTGSTASQKLHGVPIVSDGGSNDQLYVHNQSRAQHRASTDQTVTILWWLWTWVYSILSSISVAAFIPRRGPVWPLTNGVRIGLHEANKLISSAQVREKGLKILQYSLKLCVYSLPAGELARRLEQYAKNVSTSRRFFKFFRWLKHFEDLRAAHKQADSVLRMLLYLEFCTNVGADIAEDICSLERIGALPEGTLSPDLLHLAELFQFWLALIEVAVTAVKLHKQAQKVHVQGAAKDTELYRKKRLVRLDLIKYVCDIGKAVYDCQFQWSDEYVFICCSLVAAILSTNKNMIRVLAPV